jgi:chromosome segregation ATPase
MPTKTTTKTASKPALPDWQSEISEELERADQRRRAAYGILFRAAGGDDLTREEIEFLKVCGFDDSARRREQPKFSRALALLQKAGTKAQREEAAAKLAQRETELTATIGGLQVEIDRLTSELTKANQQLSAVRSDVSQRAAAVEQLQSDGNLPEYVKAQLAELRKTAANSQPAAAEREAETRVRCIKAVLALTDDSQRMLHAQTARLQDGTPLVTSRVDGKVVNPRIDLSAWARYLEELRAELPQREQELESARKELKYFDREERELREFWLQPEIEAMVLEMEAE